MKRLAAAAILLFLQEPSPVPGLLARIDDRDPAAAFRAIGDLADLGPEHRAEIEKGASALTPFYRDALTAELKRGGVRSRRVTLDGRRTLRDHLGELARRSSLEFDLDHWKFSKDEEDLLSREAFALDLKDVREFEALAAMSEAQRVLFNKPGRSDRIHLVNLGGPATGTWAQGQRSLLVIHQSAWNRKWVAPTGGGEWTAGLQFVVVPAKGFRVHEWKDVRVVEAVSEKGVDLRPKAGADSILDFPTGMAEDGPFEPDLWIEAGFPVTVRLPEGTAKASRLKISAVARVHAKYMSVEVKAKDGVAQGTGDGISVEVKKTDGGPPEAWFTIRIRAAGISGRDLADRPAYAEGTCSGQKGYVALKRLHADDKEVVYEGRWSALGQFSYDEDTPLKFESLTVHVADGLEEWPIYFEFRDIPLK